MQDNAIIRKPTVKDVPGIAELINGYAQNGIMLPRPISQLYDNLRDYYVIEIEGKIAGCGALHVTWSDLAEIRGLALKEDIKGKGYGRRLVEKFLNEAVELGVKKVFALTYQTDFFKRMGFIEINKTELPQKIWNECVNCIHFPDCNEIAMVKELD
jgi:amino-acid N-acetyltransferase